MSLSTIDNKEIKLGKVIYLEVTDNVKNMGKHLQKLMKHVKNEKLEVTGPYLTVYVCDDASKEFDPENAEVRIGVPVKNPVEKGEYKIMEINYDKTAHITVNGSYDNLHKGYEEVGKYLADNKLKPSWYPIEVYTKASMLSIFLFKSKLVTDIYFPVK